MPQGVSSDQVRASHPRSAIVERFVAEHGHALLRIVRSHARCAADADDAYQRTLEVMLTKAPATDDDQRLMAWAVTVARNEVLMQHRRGRKLSHDSFEEIAETWVDGPDGPDERLVEAERIGHGREALMRLTPDQTRLLLLRADGLSYDEICGLTGYSHAKVNRLLIEGRKSFRDRVARLASGSECRRLEGMISTYADGELRDEARADLELHLHGCVGCQATLRDFRDTSRRVGVYFPVGVAAGGSALADLWGRALESVQSLAASFQERAFTAQSSAELAFAKKSAVAAAVTASLVAGGVTLGGLDGPGSDRVAQGLNGGQPVGGIAAPRRSSDRPSPAERAKRDSEQPRAARRSDVLGDERVARTESEPLQRSPAGDSVDGPRIPATTTPIVGPGESSEIAPELAP